LKKEFRKETVLCSRSHKQLIAIQPRKNLTSVITTYKNILFPTPSSSLVYYHYLNQSANRPRIASQLMSMLVN